MGVDVDEAGRDDAARGVERARARQARADRDDALALDGDVRTPPRRPRAVDHGAAADDEIGHGTLLLATDRVAQPQARREGFSRTGEAVHTHDARSRLILGVVNRTGGVRIMTTQILLVALIALLLVVGIVADAMWE